MTTHLSSSHLSRADHSEGQPAHGPNDVVRLSAARLLVAKDVAELLGVPASLVYAMARRGQLPTVRVGERYVRFRAQAIADWISARETTVRRGLQ